MPRFPPHRDADRVRYQGGGVTFARGQSPRRAAKPRQARCRCRYRRHCAPSCPLALMFGQHLEASGKSGAVLAGAESLVFAGMMKSMAFGIGGKIGRCGHESAPRGSAPPPAGSVSPSPAAASSRDGDLHCGRRAALEQPGRVRLLQAWRPVDAPRYPSLRSTACPRAVPSATLAAPHESTTREVPKGRSILGHSDSSRGTMHAHGVRGGSKAESFPGGSYSATRSSAPVRVRSPRRSCWAGRRSAQNAMMAAISSGVATRPSGISASNPRSAAAGEVIVRHAGIGKAGGDGKAENPVCGIGARNRLVHCHHSALGGGIMPVCRRISAIGRATGDMDQPPTATARLPVPHRKARKLRGGGEVDPQGILPRIEPFDVGTIEPVGLEPSGIVDHRINFPRRPAQAPVPTGFARSADRRNRQQ